MKKITKKSTAVFSLILFIATHYVYAAKFINLPYPSMQKVDEVAKVSSPKRKLLVHGYCRGYNIPTDVCFFIRCLLYDNPFKYRNKPLLYDLAFQDLSGFDFTGCAFTHTNLTDTNLDGAILANTTCDYQKAFQDNIKQNKIQGGNWYRRNLTKDLKSIATVYVKLNNDTHKSKLLHIACGLSRLSFYEDEAFYIKVHYWSCALLRLKQTLGAPYGDQLICSLEYELNRDVNEFCWTTNYPQDKVDISARILHANFDTYLKDFTIGLTKYQCKSKNNSGFGWYKQEIVLSIKGLQKTYSNIKQKHLKQAARCIGHALSKSYQIQQKDLLYHYLFYQNRLIRLKNSLGVQVAKAIYYSAGSLSDLLSRWRRG